MAINVPTLDHQVFTPGPARDYVGHALEIAKMYPDYAKQFQQAQAAEIARQQALLKYQTDAQKAQAFLDMYPDYRAAQIAQLRARAAQAEGQIPLYAAHADYYRSRSAPVDPNIMKGITGEGFQPPPLGAEDAAPAPAAPATPTPAPAPGVDTSTLTGWD